MGIVEVTIVFTISWFIVLLPLLGIGTESQYDAGEVIPGTEEAAPVKPMLGKKALWATYGAAGITLAAYLMMSFLAP